MVRRKRRLSPRFRALRGAALGSARLSLSDVGVSGWSGTAQRIGQGCGAPWRRVRSAHPVGSGLGLSGGSDNAGGFVMRLRAHGSWDCERAGRAIARAWVLRLRAHDPCDCQRIGRASGPAHRTAALTTDQSGGHLPSLSADTIGAQSPRHAGRNGEPTAPTPPEASGGGAWWPDGSAKWSVDPAGRPEGAVTGRRGRALCQSAVAGSLYPGALGVRKPGGAEPP